MCLILFAYKAHQKYKLILAANRDEYFDRKAAEATYWKKNPSILGGIDLASKGTWLGITKNGRFAAITNYRDPNLIVKNPVSRGDITYQFLQSHEKATDFLTGLAGIKEKYNGYNVLLSDDSLDSIYYYSNINDKPEQVENGIHGLSNAFLNTPWPKVNFGVKLLSDLIKNPTFNSEDIISIMRDSTIASKNSLPNTGISLELEQKLSPVFISMKGYGTRCTTVMLLDNDQNMEFLEVSYDENAHEIAKNRFAFRIQPQ